MMTLIRVMRAITILFLLFLTLSTTIDISFCDGSSHVVCIKSERQALLSFKQHLIDPSNRLLSWAVEKNCCKWVGVVCDNLTGHVKAVHLQNPYREHGSEAEYEAYKRSKLGGKINPSLLNLKQLSYLDLSNNDFGGIQIPSFIGSLWNLKYLNFAGSRFRGTIPHQLGNLSNLVFLNLESSGSILYVENLQWISGLSSLEHLDLSGVNLSKASNWLQVINMLPSLIELRLSICELDHIPSLPHVNLTSLSILNISGNSFNSLVPKWVCTLRSLISLDFSRNNFKGPIPSSLRNMTGLRHLDLSENDFNSTIPNWLYSFSSLEFLNLNFNNLQGIISSAIGNLTSATALALSYNQLEGPIPRSLGNLCNLKELRLSENKLGGEVSEVFKNLSGCTLNSLELLSLRGNKLFGQLTDQLGQFKNLTCLSLGINSISGPIPVCIGNLSALRIFSIFRNQLNGTLPKSLGYLSKLEYLIISDNRLEGVVSKVHFANLTNLIFLSASENPLVLKVSPKWIPRFRLEYIHLRSWHLGPQFPMWLKSQKDLEGLDLSCTGISSTIPTWFWKFPTQLEYLNLSHNQIHGGIPSILGHNHFFPAIYLSYNQFSGPLPRLSSSVIHLDLSNNYFSGNISDFLCNRRNELNRLQILHLGENLLSGEISDCWMNWQSLRFINLGNNNLTGNIPSSMGYLHGLRSLHLRNNSLSGKIPLSLQNCTDLTVLDLGVNKFVGRIPTWMGYGLSSLMVLSLRSNEFNGRIPLELCHLYSLQIMDLADNNLSGQIPRCFSNLKGMATKEHSDVRISYFDVLGELLVNEFLVRMGMKLSRTLIRKYSQPFGELLENAFVVTKGRQFQYDTILTLMASLDLSSNNLSGEVPEELTSLLGLLSLNLSDNQFTGRIPKKIGNMESLESLDLSRNQLSGEIPPSMSSMNFLNYLNLSHNNLLGKIPSSTQLQSFNTSSFVGNQLCGPPLTENCSADRMPPNVGNGGDEEGDGFRVKWFYLTMMLGFVVGFWGVCGPLLFNKSWRCAYFLCLDQMWYKLCDSFGKFY